MRVRICKPNEGENTWRRMKICGGQGGGDEVKDTKFKKARKNI
jgi:hypothetical protein